MSIGDKPANLCVAERDADLISGLLVREGLLAPVSGGLFQITPAGQVMRAFYMLADKESGPWSITDLRLYAAVKRLDMETCHASLAKLIQCGIVVAKPSKRTSKWELTNR